MYPLGLEPSYIYKNTLWVSLIIGTLAILETIEA